LPPLLPRAERERRHHQEPAASKAAENRCGSGEPPEAIREPARRARRGERVARSEARREAARTVQKVRHAARSRVRRGAPQQPSGMRERDAAV